MYVYFIRIESWERNQIDSEHHHHTFPFSFHKFKQRERKMQRERGRERNREKNYKVKRDICTKHDKYTQMEWGREGFFFENENTQLKEMKHIQIHSHHITST